MDLDLPSLIGRRPVARSAVEVRQLTDADLAMLSTERGIAPKELKRLGDAHHALARALASGMKPAEASILTGYTVSRISVLRTSPQFQDLVEFYSAHQTDVYADVQARMQNLSLDALETLRTRLEEEPEEFGSAMLLEIVKTLADRTGFGPSSKTTNLNVNLDLAGRLERARARIKEIEAAPVEASEEEVR